MNPGYQNFLETLSQQCRDAATGVLHLYTTLNQYGRFALVGGEITHISLHSARGMTALPVLLLAAISSHRFEIDARLPLMDDLVDTPDILAMLGAGELESMAAAQVLAPGFAPAAIPPSPAAAAVSTPTPDAPVSEPPPRGISPAALHIIEQALHQELGPMARSLVQEGLPHSATAYQLAEYLADQLMPAEGEKFLTQVTAQLRSPSAA